MQLAAIGEHDLVEAPRWVARLGLVHVDGDYVAGCQGTLAPADQYKRLRGSRFSNPMLDFAFVILRIELYQAVRVRPRELRHRRLLQCYRLVRKSRISMMRKQRTTENYKTKEYCNGQQQLAFHTTLLNWKMHSY